jgi:RNA polymerase-binding transcription factor DksA
MGKHKPAKKVHHSKKASKAKSPPKPVKKASVRSTEIKPKHTPPVAKKSPAENAHPKAKPAAAQPKSPAKPKAAPATPAPAKAVQPPARSKPAKKQPAPAPAATTAPAADSAAPARLTPDQLRKQLISKARSRSKPQRAAVFTLDDVRGELARASVARSDQQELDRPQNGQSSSRGATASSRSVESVQIERRQFGAASLADILGYNPAAQERPVDEDASIDPKYLRYYRLLVQLRDHVTSGLDMHTEETLKRSNREDSGDLSGYGQHMADAGTDNFDRDFALSLVSNEQEALFEIEEAIKRIKAGTYGICELTGKPISKDRLLAVPFARFSVESQMEIERSKRRSSHRGGVFADTTTEEGSKLLEEESE